MAEQRPWLHFSAGNLRRSVREQIDDCCYEWATPEVSSSTFHALPVAIVHLKSSSYHTWRCGGGSFARGWGRFRSHLLPPGAEGGINGSGCFHFSKMSSVSWYSALCSRGSLMILFASNNDRMYKAWPLHCLLSTHQSRDSLSDRLYSDCTVFFVDMVVYGLANSELFLC